MSANKKRILHLEDDRDIQRYISVILSDVAEITPANTLKEARALVKSTPFDLVMTDFTLPDGSGSDFVIELAKQHPSIPVIVFSVHEVSDTMVNVSKVFVKGRLNVQDLISSVQTLCK